MNRKQLITLVVILAVLGAAGFLASQRNKPSGQDQNTALSIGGKLLPDFTINDIAQVAVVQSTQQMTLAKTGDIWTVKERGEYPANFANITELARKLWEMKVTKPVVVSASRLAALELVPPDKGAGTHLLFKDASGKTITSLLLGAKHMRESSGDSQFGGGGSWPDGRYVMVNDDLKRVALLSDPLSNVEAKPSEWLDKDFFKVEKLKSITVAAPEPTNQWKLVRPAESGPWTLADAKEGEAVDTAKVSSANYLLSSPYFTDVRVNPSPAETGLDQPRVATLETFDDFTYVVKLGKPAADESRAIQVEVTASLPKERTPGPDEKAEDKAKLDLEFKDKVDKAKEKLKKEQAYAKWTYDVSKWTIEFLLKSRPELLAEKKPDQPSPLAPAPASAPGTPLVPTPGSVTSAPIKVEIPPPAPAPTTPPAPAPEVPKPEAPKPEAPKPEAPKPEAPKP